MKTIIGLVSAALLGLGAAVAIADEEPRGDQEHIVVSELADSGLPTAAQQAEPALAQAVADEGSEPERHVRIVGPTFFPDE